MNEINNILKEMEYGPAPESDAHARQWLEEWKGTFPHFINGEFKRSKSGGKFTITNPATGETLGQIFNGTPRDVDQAVDAAQAAFKTWSRLSTYERAQYLYAIARHIQKHARLFAVIETIDNGKPIRETRDLDVPLAARHFYHHAGLANLRDEIAPNHQPVGVCGQVIPWNFPLLMLAWKIAPALAAGNTVVLKPAEFTPLSALAFARICQEVGLPAGVVNIVFGDGKTGQAVIDHQGIRKLAFTGSTRVGRLIRQRSAGHGKKLSLELGGKSPFIVFEDADLDAAIEGIVDAIFFNQGEVCCAGSRLLVQESIADRFYKRLRQRMETLRLGSPLDKSIDIGALVDPSQVERVLALIKAAGDEGANVWQPAISSPDSGCFVAPTLITDVEPASTVAQDEIFGPVLVAMTFRTPGEAAELANNTRFGLAASIWTQTIDTAYDLASRVKAGIVWINSTNQFDAMAPFGGYRESGFGREGGREGLFEYLKPDWEVNAKSIAASKAIPQPLPQSTSGNASIDRTAKLYIGGKQTRPDSGYSYPVLDPKGKLIAEVGLGNRKDIRNAVEAAHAARKWTAMTGAQRAQVLYFLAENLKARDAEFADRIRVQTGTSKNKADSEVARAVERIFYYAAAADNFDGKARQLQSNMLGLVLPEAWGVVGVSCPDEAPLIGLISLVLPLIAMGNRVVVSPSPTHPLSSTDFYQVLDTSDVPGGVVNIVTGDREELAQTMAGHHDIACHWYVGTGEGSGLVEAQSAGNLKSTWVNNGLVRDWFDNVTGQGDDYLRKAVQYKTIWTPYGA